MNTINNITLIGIGATFIATFIAAFIAAFVSVYYGRKNLKTSKFIETITSERIKWLSLIRDEVSELVTNIQFSMKEYLDDIYMNTLERQDYNMSPEEDLEYRLSYFNSPIGVGVKDNNIRWSAPDYITRLRLLQLRLNPKEDTTIIESLQFFIKIYSSPGVNRETAEKAQNHIDTIISETQIMLKKEWEKVKKESRGKRSK